jgi:hypothetical protein
MESVLAEWNERSRRNLPRSADKIVAVVRLVANQALRLRFDYVEVATQLHQARFVMIHGMLATVNMPIH